MAERPNVKHEGCTDCRSQEQVILGSIYAPEKKMSIGVCETCRGRREHNTQ